MANIHNVVRSNTAMKIVNAAYGQQKDPSEVLKELHARGFSNVQIEQIEQQWEQWDQDSTDTPQSW